MAKELKPIDISDLPELVRIAEEVRRSGEPRLLRSASQDLAILTPARPGRRARTRRPKTKADIEAFRSAAGGWKDVDTDRLLADIYADRWASDRPPVDL